MTFDTVFQIGRTIQGENLYWDVLHRQPPLYVWAKKESSRAPGIQQYVQWVDQLFEFRGEIYLRDDLVQPPPVLPGSAKKGSAKAARTARARDARFVAHACLRCGHSTTEQGKRSHSSSLKIARVNQPITVGQAVRLIDCGANSVVRSLMSCQRNYAVSELPWRKLLRIQL